MTPLFFNKWIKIGRSTAFSVASHYPEFESPAFEMLCDQRDVWLLNDPKTRFDLKPGEATKDIELLFWGYDSKMEARLKSDFPGAQYDLIPQLEPRTFPIY